MKLLPAIVVSAVLAAPAYGADDVFEKTIQPIFANHCFKCHSPVLGKVKSGLELDTPEAILRGASSGPVVVPGKSKESLLLQSVHKDGSPHMPPKGQLSDDELKAIAAWIDGLQTRSTQKAATSDHWAFRKPEQPAIPAVRDAAWARSPIDSFILATLESKGLKPSAPASKADLLRRAYFDLIGLPPSPEDVQAFLKDPSPDAFAKVIDKLLASPQYGERWGRHWLDLARYADTGGFHSDIDRPNAWRYRDYVIRSFNEDKPYPQFIREQLAGDEVAPGNVDALIATGFSRNGPSNEDNMGKNAKDKEKYRIDELDGVISTTGTVFLGLTIGCARCHDHKYDPITQRDYYSVLAIFDNTQKQEIPLPGSPPPPAPKEGEKPKKAAGPAIMALVEDPKIRRTTHLLWRGDVSNPGPVVLPAVPASLSPVSLEFTDSKTAKTTGRRTIFADWIASTENPLTYRVLANRIWQHHLGRGIVYTSGNFGKSGAAPSHPELLDYLALELAANGGRLKPLHRAIMLSSVYQQSSVSSDAGFKVDPENTLLWRQNKRRLEAEAIRDSILAISGKLNAKPGGPGAKPRIRADLLPASQRNKWPVVEKEGPDQWRRSVYIYVKRQLLLPVLELFDAPTTTDVCDRRQESVVPTQALVLMNDEFVNEQAGYLAERVKSAPTSKARAERTLWLALGRPPTANRITEAEAFLASQTKTYTKDGRSATEAEAMALTDLCHVLFNCNEFVYLD